MKVFRYIAVLFLTAVFVSPASAATTGSWHWEDISSKIPVSRANWSVTSVGNLAGDWYFTNGKDFSKGGKVWKMWADGHISEITGSLKKAGLIRVARIDSTGSYIKYYQDFIVGKMNKVAVWDGTQVKVMTEPNPAIVIPELPALHFAAYRPEGAFFAGGESATGQTSKLINETYPEGNYTDKQVTDISDQLAVAQDLNWKNGLSSWNGKTWMILLNHDLLQFDGEKLTYLGRTRDKFFSIASMEDGSFLLGGKTTDVKSVAKLVRVTEDVSVVAPVPVQPVVAESQAASAGTTFLRSIKPDVFVNGKRTLSASTDGSYGVTATNDGGVKTLELMVNGVVKQTCDGAGERQVYCNLTLKAGDYPNTTILDLSARATDKINGIVEDAVESIVVSR